MKPTRREIVYNVLRDRANEWVNVADLMAAGSGSRYGGRIHDLRKAGHTILARRSSEHDGWDYKHVIEDVGAPGQIAWLAAV